MDELSNYSYEEIRNAMFKLNQRGFLLEVRKPYGCGYAVLSNCFVRSTNLGCPAIGLLGRVTDLPPEWNFTKAGLIAVCPDGETAVESALADFIFKSKINAYSIHISYQNLIKSQSFLK